MTRLDDLDMDTRMWLLRANFLGDMYDVAWSRMAHTPLSSWVVYPDNTMFLVTGGDGAMDGTMVPC